MIVEMYGAPWFNDVRFFSHQDLLHASCCVKPLANDHCSNDFVTPHNGVDNILLCLRENCAGLVFVPHVTGREYAAAPVLDSLIVVNLGE